MVRRDLVGQRFDLLVAQTVEVQSVYGLRQSVWTCTCDCGNQKEVTASDLLKGNTRSCGCLLRTTHRDVSVGTRFGKLVIVKRLENLKYLCRCDCGNESEVLIANLRKGSTVSCGCYHKVKAITHGMTYTKEYRVQKARKRRDLKRALDSNWTLEMNQLLKETQPICMVCESTDRLAVDHVRPLGKGYGLRPGNAVMLCIRCNSAKKDRDMEDLPYGVAAKILEAAQRFQVIWEMKMESA